jgi:hypothetical protein
MPGSYSPEMERAARQQGFTSAEQMMLWQKQRNTPTGGTVQGKTYPKGTTSDGRSIPSMDDATSWHPKVIFERLAQALLGARR